MKDKDGFTIKCIYSEWRCIDDFWNHDFVCCENGYRCYGDETCKRYKPEEESDEGLHRMQT